VNFKSNRYRPTVELIRVQTSLQRCALINTAVCLSKHPVCFIVAMILRTRRWMCLKSTQSAYWHSTYAESLCSVSDRVEHAMCVCGDRSHSCKHVQRRADKRRDVLYIISNDLHHHFIWTECSVSSVGSLTSSVTSISIGIQIRRYRRAVYTFTETFARAWSWGWGLTLFPGVFMKILIYSFIMIWLIVHSCVHTTGA